MPALNITNSSNIASLDSKIEANLCEGVFTVDLSPSIFIGSGADNVLGASVKMTNPYGVIIRYPTTSGYDIYPPMTSNAEVDIPTQANNYQYGNYTVDVYLTDANGTIYTLSKPVNICAPNPKNKNVNYGSLSATLDGNCVTGRVTIIADTVPAYKGAISDSQVNDFTLKYPTISEKAPEETNIGAFSAQLFEGEYRFEGTICAHYSLGDNIFANVNYKVKRYKTIRCLLDKSCVAVRLAELQYQISQDCTDKEKIETQNTIINALLLIQVIDGLTNDGQDASDYIAQLEQVLGCVCTCNCADGTPIIPINPTGDFVVEGCNVSSATVGLTTTYTIENYAYVLEYTSNGGAITITAPVLDDCTQTQTLIFNIEVVYSQIKALVTNSTEYNFWASVVNNALTGLDGTCLGLTANQMNALPLKSKLQYIINEACSGGDCDAVITVPIVGNVGTDVSIAWTNNDDVFAVEIYLDDILKGSVISPTHQFTIAGAADGDTHTYKLISRCSNGSVGSIITDSFTYFGCPFVAAPTVIDANVEDATCPYDLTALVNTLPLGIAAEWHNLHNSSITSLVPDPTAVTGGTYYVYAKNSDGCYSTATQVILTCSTDTACSAPQGVLVESIIGGFRVRFQSATYPPPSNSYTVKRRLKSSPDVSGSYTTIGTPAWNSSVSRWEILDSTPSNNTLYVYRVISNCTSSSPYADYDFANITCPTVALTPADTSVSYSFTGVGGGVDKYEVRIYDSTGVTLIHTDTIVPAFSNPITGTFVYLTAGVVYTVKVRVYIGTYYKDCTSQTTETTGGNGWEILNTNNDPTLNMSLLLGNNNTTPATSLYSGTYISDPVTGTSGSLPAINANVSFSLSGGRTIVNATCNGISGTITGGGATASWSGVNGSVRINFVSDF